MQGIVSKDTKRPFSIRQGMFGMWCDYWLPFSHVDPVRQAKGIENDSMVAQLLKDDTVKTQDRESYEQNIKDCATSSFIGEKLNGTPAVRSLTLLRSAKLARIQ